MRRPAPARGVVAAACGSRPQFGLRRGGNVGVTMDELPVTLLEAEYFGDAHVHRLHGLIVRRSDRCDLRATPECEAARLRVHDIEAAFTAGGEVLRVADIRTLDVGGTPLRYSLRGEKRGR